MVSSSELIVASDEVSIAAQVDGDGRDAVVLVHGHGTNLATWRPLVEHVSGMTVVSYDRRGHGRSELGTCQGIGDMSTDLARVCAELQLVRPIVVGHSVGAWDALWCAASHPTLFGAVLCLDQAIAVDDPCWQEYYPPSTLAGRLAPMEPVDDDTIMSGTQAAAWMDDRQRDPRRRPWPRYEPMFRRALTRVGDDAWQVRPTAHGLARIEAGWTSVNSEPYSRIEAPIQLVLATRNTGTLHRAFRRLAARRGLALTLIDADHDLHLSHPEAVAELIKNLAG